MLERKEPWMYEVMETVVNDGDYGYIDDDMHNSYDCNGRRECI